ncbi:MAG: FtsX-like permease family protein, partial [Lachnospiraceae bacterium]|nr:FtsX-like permease family protein [Lachnospiraceae bacterium]
MFFRILGKDLKRKKIMNIILLLFVILSTMFASSSVNNMVSVYGGIDYFFDKANMPDFVMLTLNTGGENPTEEIVRKAAAVTSYGREDMIYFAAKDLLKDGTKYVEFENPGLITSIDDADLNYFDSSDEKITEIPRGHVYFSGLLADPDKTHIGDTVTIKLWGVSLDFVIDGYCKDALFSSPFLGNPRVLMNDADVKTFLADEEIRKSDCGCVYYINTDDMKALKNDIADIPSALFAQASSVIKLTYMLDMLTAAIILVVSICLILISFTMLSFTIKFTLTEDFREIGVMKAVGLKNKAVRGLYMIKYLCIACVGAVIGYILSVPFGGLLLKSVSSRIVLGNDNSVLLGIISAIAVVGIIVAFCYSCTSSIKKMSPIDAVRSGETGERYHKKSILRLSKSKASGNMFLALNDVLCKPRQYVSMLITFTVCLLLITMLANTANTLMSDRLVFLFGTTESDAYYSSTELIMETMGTDDPEALDRIIERIEKKLKDNGIPGKVHVELMYILPVEFKGEKTQMTMQQCKVTRASDYVYSEGTAPMYENEVAFTPQVLKDLGAEIGDRVTIEINGVKKEFLITAAFSSFNQMGQIGRFHEDVPLKVNDASSAHAFQIDFDDDPTDEVIKERIEKLRKIFNTTKIYDKAGFVDVSTGSASTVNYAKNLVMIIALIIAAMVTVLMERSFISKESGEIALMKAIGFKSRSVSAQHTLRFVILMLAATVIASALTLPVTKLVCDRIFAIMGAVSGIRYAIVPLQIFVLYP